MDGLGRPWIRSLMQVGDHPVDPDPRGAVRSAATQHVFTSSAHIAPERSAKFFEGRGRWRCGTAVHHRQNHLYFEKLTLLYYIIKN
jgi:hypothetical protein